MTPISNPNGTHQNLSICIDIEPEISLSVTECQICFSSTEVECDCHLVDEEDYTSSDYEEYEDYEEERYLTNEHIDEEEVLEVLGENEIFPHSPPDIKVRRYRYIY